MHRRNAAERSIETWKNTFISDLNGTYKLFPMYLWERLMDKSQIMLNMIRSSRRNAWISVHAMMEGNHHFNKIPFVPPFKKFIGNEKPNRSWTWVHNGIQVWYIGPSVEYYRCYKVYISNTGAELITDTMELFPENTKIPGMSSTNSVTHASKHLIRALKIHHQPPCLHPYAQKN